MPSVIAKLYVEDFEKWHEEYERMHPVRAEHGERGHRAYRSPDDPNMVVVVFEWDSHDRARAYFSSPELTASVGRADGRGTPEVFYLEPA